MSQAGIINTDISALRTISSLNQSQKEANRANAALSTGKRVRGPADDAAAYAISQRMETQITGYAQGLANASQGVSLLQTVTGAMQQQIDLLQQLHTLAVQAANGSNTQSDRAALQNQAEQLISGLQNIAQQSQFNGKNILDGSFAGQSFQVGSNQEQVVPVGVPDSRANAIGNYVTTVAGPAFSASGAFSEDGFQPGGAYSFSPGAIGNWTSGTGSSGLQIVGSAGSARVDIPSSEASAASIAAGVNAVASRTGVTATATTSVAFGVSSGSYSFYLSTGAMPAPQHAVHIAALVPSAAIQPNQQLNGLVSEINSSSTISGVRASVEIRQGQPQLVLTSLTGENINISASVPVQSQDAKSNTLITSGYTILTGTVVSSGSNQTPAVVDGLILTDAGQLLQRDYLVLPPGQTLPPAGTKITNRQVSNVTPVALLTQRSLPAGSTLLSGSVLSSEGSKISGTSYTYGGILQGLVMTSAGTIYSGTFQLPADNFLPPQGTVLPRGKPIPEQTLLSTPPGQQLESALATGSTGTLTALGEAGTPISGAYPLTSQSAFVSLQGAVQFASSSSYRVEHGENIGFTPTATGILHNAVNNINLGHAWSAQQAMKISQEAIAGLTDAVAGLGALQKRLQSAASNDQTAFVNVSSAKSTIVDANVARDVGRQTQAQILTKAGISTLSIEYSALRAYLKLLP